METLTILFIILLGLLGLNIILFSIFVYYNTYFTRAKIRSNKEMIKFFSKIGIDIKESPNQPKFKHFENPNKSKENAEKKAFDFGKALSILKAGGKVYRQGWNGKGMWLDLQKPDAHSKMTLPYIFIEYPPNPKHPVYPNGSRVPWLASETDMLAEDWLEKGEQK